MPSTDYQITISQIVYVQSADKIPVSRPGRYPYYIPPIQNWKKTHRSHDPLIREHGCSRPAPDKYCNRVLSTVCSSRESSFEYLDYVFARKRDERKRAKNSRVRRISADKSTADKHVKLLCTTTGNNQRFSPQFQNHYVHASIMTYCTKRPTREVSGFLSKAMKRAAPDLNRRSRRNRR